MTNVGDHDITRRALLVGLGSTVALGTLALSGAMAGEDWPAVQAAALKEGKLSFYHNLRPQGRLVDDTPLTEARYLHA